MSAAFFFYTWHQSKNYIYTYGNIGNIIALALSFYKLVLSND